jgi:hypothetical protein
MSFIELREREGLFRRMSVVQFRYMYTYSAPTCIFVQPRVPWYLGDITTRLCVARHSSNLSREFQVRNLTLKYPITPHLKRAKSHKYGSDMSTFRSQ